MTTQITNDEPLSGITVVDLTQVVAGPFATMSLGDYGAEVIKIEAVGRGDRSRSSIPSPEYFNSINRNKRSIALNLKNEEGQELAKELVSDADVFVHNMKPGRIEKFNLDYEELVSVNPSLIYCTISGFGTGSPYEHVPAWDFVIQAMSGIMSMTGTEETPPLWSGLPSGDLAAAMYATQSILLALYARDTGEIESEWIEVPMLDAAVSWLSSRAGHTFGLDEPFPRYGTRHPSAAPFGVFSAGDEKLVIAASSDSLWEDLCTALDREDLLEDERFESRQGRLDHRDVIAEAIESTMQADPDRDWVGYLQDRRIPAGPINDTKTVWDDPHVKQRELHVTMEHETHGEAEMIDHPVHFTELATSLRIPPQNLGESTDDLLARHGVDPERVQELRDADIIG